MKLTAKRVEFQGIFGQVNVWLDDTLIGDLTPDAAEANAVVDAINAADATADLLAACKALNKSLLPYRGTDMGPDNAYICSRIAIGKILAAIAKAEG